METMEKAVVYARVSSKVQEETGYSLPEQKKLAENYATRVGCKVVKIFTVAESASGSKQRKVFAEMIEYATKNKINFILCEKVDRLTRNFREAVLASDWIEADSNRQIHFLKNNLVYSTNSKSDEKFRFDIEVVLAKKYIANLSEEVKKGQAGKLAAGGFPTVPPTGYKSVGEHRRKVTVVDVEAAPLIRKMFELYATGTYSILGLTKKMKQMGLRNRFGNPISKTRIHQLLANPFYCGDMVWNEKVHEGSHEPLISRALFKEVQTKLNRGTASPYYSKHSFVHKGNVSCGVCGARVSWENQKGHVYGACKRCKNNMAKKARYIRQEDFDQMLIEQVISVAPKSERIVKILNQALKEDAAGEIEVYEAKKEKLQDALARGDRRIDLAYTDRLDGRITTERYDLLKDSWDSERKSLLEELNKISDDKSLYYEAGFSIHVLAERAERIYKNKKVSNEDRRLLLSYAFSNIELEAGKIKVSYTPAFEFLSKWVPPVNEHFEPTNGGSIKGKSDSNEPLCPAVCAGRDSNLRRLMPADLQSALVDRLSTDAII
jgi:site-specific DNA recombinase